MGVDKAWRGIRSECRSDLGCTGATQPCLLQATRSQTGITHCTQRGPWCCFKMNLPWAFWQRHQALCWRSCFCATYLSAQALPWRALAAPALQPGRKYLGRWGRGWEWGWTQGKRRRDCEGATDPKFTAIVSVCVPHHIQTMSCFPSKDWYFLPSWLLCNGQSRYWGKHSRKENILQTNLEGIGDVLFVKEYKIAQTICLQLLILW